MSFLKASVLGSLLFLVVNVQANFKTPPLFAQWQQQNFSYHLQGDVNAPNVLLLGGGPGFSSWNLEPIQTKITAMGYRVLLADMLGIGENQHLKTQPVLKAWVEQIDAILAQQLKQGQKVILVGHSWGAIMAMLYAQTHNEKVAKIILLNPVDPEKAAMQNLTDEIHLRNGENIEIDWESDQAWSNEIDESQQSLDHLTLRQIQQVLPTYFMDYELGVKYAKQFTVKDFDIDLNIQAWKEYDQNPIKFKTINQFKQPVSFIDCNQDYLMPYNLNAMQKNMQFQQVDLIDQCGHFPWIEQSQIFYGLLREHLVNEPSVAVKSSNNPRLLGGS